MKLLREWAVVCQALDQGHQIFIARKGGIAEEEGEFILRDSEFCLWPVHLHQNKEAIKPKYHLDLESSVRSEPPELKDGKIHLRNYARVTDFRKTGDESCLEKMEEEHIWTTQFLRQRFEWGKEIGLNLLILRVYRFSDEIILPIKKEYRGCKSWVNIEEKIDPPLGHPVLSDLEFSAKRNRLMGLMEGLFS